MNSECYTLSVEEVAYCMGLLGESEAAGGFLLAVLGEIEEQEMDGHLFAASHSLIARGYLDIDLDTSEQRLDQGVAKVLQVLLQHEYSLRCSRLVNDEEELVNYFFGRDDIVEHRLAKGVVSRVERIKDTQGVVRRCQEFSQLLPEDIDGSPGEYLGTIPHELIREATLNTSEATGQEMTSQLAGAGLSAEIAGEVVEDIISEESRGSIVRVDNKDGEMESNEGFLFLKGPNRSWLFEIVPEDPPLLDIFRGSVQQFKISLEKLLG